MIFLQNNQAASNQKPSYKSHLLLINTLNIHLTLGLGITSTQQWMSSGDSCSVSAACSPISVRKESVEWESSGQSGVSMSQVSQSQENSEALTIYPHWQFLLSLTRVMKIHCETRDCRQWTDTGRRGGSGPHWPLSSLQSPQLTLASDHLTQHQLLMNDLCCQKENNHMWSYPTQYWWCVGWIVWERRLHSNTYQTAGSEIDAQKTWHLINR